MTVLSKVEKVRSLTLHPQIFTCRVKHLFVFSHMRSRSTLLTHILGSNAGICGYGESFRSYSNWYDLLKMRVDLFLDLREELQDKFLLDKILHNHLHISDSIFKKTRPRIIFLLRKPESTMKSIISMAHHTGIKSLMEPEYVLDYYSSRLAELKFVASGLENEYFFIESDDLINNTDAVLENLTLWLGLGEPLESHYSTFNNTGKPGVGDPSRNIRAGVIQKTKEHSGIKLASEIVKEGKLSYENCKAYLIKHSRQSNILPNNAD